MLREAEETLSVALARSAVTASVIVSARRCSACDELHVDGAVVRRFHLAVGCELANLGVRTGEALRHMRKALGLRAAELAALLDVTPETISHWETGKVLPNRAAFVAVAALVQDALDGRSTTRERLSVVPDGRGRRALAIKLP